MIRIPIIRRPIIWLIPLLLIIAGLVVCNAVRTAPAPVPQACPGERFLDVCPSDWFHPYVLDLATLNAISGYSTSPPCTTGTPCFLPYNNITRGQIMKVIVIATDLTGALPPTPTFEDVPTAQPFYTWIEIGVANGVVSGYTCGGVGEPCDPPHRPYFRPGANVNRGQIAKMIVNARQWPLDPPQNPTFEDVPTTSPYFPYVERAVSYGVISGYQCGGVGEPCPGSYFRPVANSTRAQASKIISLARNITPTPTVTGTPPSATPTQTRRPSNTPTRTVTPVPTTTPGGPCVLFPADNIWNRNIAALPTHALSDAYINTIGLNTGLHPDFGSGLYNGGPIGIPYTAVPGSQPRVPIAFSEPQESDPGPYPIPTNAPIEGGPNSTGDRHVLVVEQGTCTLYEMDDSHPHADGSWNAYSGALWHLPLNALRPDTWTSADAAGLPILPGLASYDEVATGVIRHALRFTANTTQRAYLWPARHYASSLTDPNQPPMGLRVRLKASVNISTYPTQLRVILQALKDYGMFLADNGSSWYVSGMPDERWDNDILHEIGTLHGSDFEAVDESGLMIDPNSGQSR